MKRSEIQRYEKALLHKVPGLRLRKRVRSAFWASSQALLEETPDPDYPTLLDAFGPPEDLAAELIHTIPDPPQPWSLRKKVGIAAVSCLLVVLVVLGGYFLLEVPESDAVVLDESSEAVLVLDTLLPQYSGLNLEPFTEADFVWK